MSARAAAEGMHRVGEGVSPVGRDWTYLDEREQRRRQKVGLPSWREEVESQQRKLFTEAYIEYTSDHGPQDRYEEAVRYLDELRRR